jgi:hypothetical protein
MPVTENSNPRINDAEHRHRPASRLFARQGKRDEARAMLTEIYNWLTEGVDTADLKDAKALLDELSNSPS